MSLQAARAERPLPLQPPPRSAARPLRKIFLRVPGKANGLPKPPKKQEQPCRSVPTCWCAQQRQPRHPQRPRASHDAARPPGVRSSCRGSPSLTDLSGEASPVRHKQREKQARRDSTLGVRLTQLLPPPATPLCLSRSSSPLAPADNVRASNSRGLWGEGGVERRQRVSLLGIVLMDG